MEVAEGLAGGMFGEPGRGGCGLGDPLEERLIGTWAETGWRLGRAGSGGAANTPQVWNAVPGRHHGTPSLGRQGKRRLAGGYSCPTRPVKFDDSAAGVR